MNVNLIFILIPFLLLFSISMSIQKGSKPNPYIISKYITYPEELERTCILCGSQVRFCYPSGGHTYAGFFGKVKEIRKFYSCTNPECSLFNKPLNPTPLNVLPFKRYSLAVWKWIAEEAKIYGQKPGQIYERIQGKFGVEISESTIRKYIKEIDAYLSHQIDKKTLEIVSEQGEIILALDGQKPDDKGASLWLFVDLLSNRVLNIQLLSSADHLTLHSEVEHILKAYGVELKAIVSDKQNSIVKMRDTFYPKIPHQYCHFHFLQNLWNHIEVKDGNLHKELKKAVNNLYIMSAAKSVKIKFDGLGKASIREVFHEIELVLRSLIKAQTRKFKRLRGIQVYEKLNKFVKEMEQTLARENADLKVVELMKKTSDSLRNSLDELNETYKVCVDLHKSFQAIRKELGKEPPRDGRKKVNLLEVKERKMEALDAQFNTIWKEVKGKYGINKKSDLKAFQPQKDTPKDKIKQEWVRLYLSYRRGLFTYYDLPIPAKTNSPMEGKFGQQKSLFISRVGKKRVGSQVRIHGGSVLKQLYVGKEEVKNHVRAMGLNYDREDVKRGLELLAERTHEETKSWKNKIDTTAALKAVLSKHKSPLNNTSSRKEDNSVG